MDGGEVVSSRMSALAMWDSKRGREALVRPTRREVEKVSHIDAKLPETPVPPESQQASTHSYIKREKYLATCPPRMKSNTKERKKKRQRTELSSVVEERVDPYLVAMRFAEESPKLAALVKQ